MCEYYEYDWDDFSEDEMTAYDFYEIEHGQYGDGDITADENWEGDYTGEGIYL